MDRSGHNNPMFGNSESFADLPFSNPDNPAYNDRGPNAAYRGGPTGYNRSEDRMSYGGDRMPSSDRMGGGSGAAVGPPLGMDSPPPRGIERSSMGRNATGRSDMDSWY